jgi:diacylglycerol kinase family enzyme
LLASPLSSRRANDAAAACQRITDGEQQLTDVSVLRQIGSHTQAAAADANPAAAAAAAAAGASPGAAACNAAGSECRYFVNVASCGAGALAAAQTASLKQLGPLCYPVAGALALLRWKGCKVQVGLSLRLTLLAAIVQVVLDSPCQDASLRMCLTPNSLANTAALSR